MRIYACFDDTDTIDCGRGTGKLVRWFEDELPEGCSFWAVVRQQLLVDDAIPYTSHNSSACAVIEAPGTEVILELTERAIAHIERHSVEGSDPGLCIVAEGDPTLPALMEFGRLAASSVTSQAAAMAAARGTHLSGHGGTNDGIIGAAAGAGLTAWGWAGRLIEYAPARLRDFEDRALVSEITSGGIRVVALDKDGSLPRPADMVTTEGWLRPRLWGNEAVLPVVAHDDGWKITGRRHTA